MKTEKIDPRLQRTPCRPLQRNVDGLTLSIHCPYYIDSWLSPQTAQVAGLPLFTILSHDPKI